MRQCSRSLIVMLVVLYGCSSETPDGPAAGSPSADAMSQSADGRIQDAAASDDASDGAMIVDAQVRPDAQFLDAETSADAGNDASQGRDDAGRLLDAARPSDAVLDMGGRSDDAAAVDDQGAIVDAAVVDDAAVVADADVQEDMARAVDAAPIVDAGANPDDMSPPDAGPNDAAAQPVDMAQAQCPETPCALGLICSAGRCIQPEPECRLSADCPGRGACLMGVCELPSCEDGIGNQDETDVDCGGGCQPCAIGLSCLIGEDCAARVCDVDSLICQAPRCDDGVTNGSEVDVDCGGQCEPCTDGAHCVDGADCVSGVCRDGHCAEADCIDGVQNGDETDLDCGGDCLACGDGDACLDNDDCANGNCLDGACQQAACGDNVQNGQETDLDCGGPACAGCAAAARCLESRDCASQVCADGLCQDAACDDDVLNGAEVDVDCGGGCQLCRDGQACQRAQHCQSRICLGNICQAPRCDDGAQNAAETDADCGGNCAPCEVGLNCQVAADCRSQVCSENQCQAPACDDRVFNGQETDQDCGGPCDVCNAGQRCSLDADCNSGVCTDGLCAEATCDDGIQNGDETDLDCGGSCTGCVDGLGCRLGSDCESRVCDGLRCAVPRCDDGVTNGDETDQDCGGPCSSCAIGQTCIVANDCVSRVCNDGVCPAPSCDDGVLNGDEVGVDCGSECASCSCVGDAVIDIAAVGDYATNTIDRPSFEMAGCAETDGASEAVFRFVSDEDGVFCADAAGSQFDSVVYVRTDCSDPSSEIACNDSPDYPRIVDGQAQFFASENQAIYIFVDAYSGAFTERPDRGEAALSLSRGRCDGEPICQGAQDCGANQRCDRGICADEPVPCEGFGDCPFDRRCDNGLCVAIGAFACNTDEACGANRRCVNAGCEDPPPTGSCLPDRIVVLDGVGIYSGTTAAAPATHSATCDDSQLSSEVVHRFRAAQPGQHCVQTIGSDFDTIAYSRFNCQQPFSETGCNNDSPLGGVSSQFSFFAAVDQDTFVIVDGNDDNGASNGEYTLIISEGDCPECLGNDDCGAGRLCRDSVCAFAPQENAVIFSELSVGDANTGYVELYNPSVFPVELTACTVRIAGQQTQLGQLLIQAGEYAVLGAGGAQAVDGPLNPGNVTLELRCNDVVIDRLDTSTPGWPQGFDTLALSADVATADLSGHPRAWCSGLERTPGRINPNCDRCALQPCQAEDETVCQGNRQVSSTTVCSVVAGQLDNRCEEQITEVVCPGGLCLENRCVRRAGAGDLVISELMVDPIGSTDVDGEWIEIHNPTADQLALATCSLKNGRFTSPLGDRLLVPGGYLTYARNANIDDNGGVSAAGSISFALANNGEQVDVVCADVVVDTVDYSSFDVEPGYSLSLSPTRLSSDLNDQDTAWCFGQVAYGAGPDRGSPGLANPVCQPCQPNPCTTPPQNFCDGQTALVFADIGECAVVDEQATCQYQPDQSLCLAGTECIEGACVPVELPCNPDPCPIGTVCNSVTQACDQAPDVGTCAQPTVINWSPATDDLVSFTGSTLGANSALDGATCGDGAFGPEAVYQLTLPQAGVFCVSTDGGDARFDPMLHIRTECADPLTELEPPSGFGCNDDIGDWDGDGECDLAGDACRTAAEMQVNGAAGESYYIIVDNRVAGTTSNYTLSLLPGPCPAAPAAIECIADENCEEGEICRDGACQQPPGPNAACQPDLIVQLDGPGRYSGRTEGGPFGLDATCSDTGDKPEVVHRVQFDSDTPVCVSTQGSNFDTVLSVRRTCENQEVACNDDLAEPTIIQSKLEFNATAGTDYYVIVDGWNLAAPGFGDYVLTIVEGRCADAPGLCEQDGTCPGTCRDPIVIRAEGEWEIDTSDAAAAIDQASCTNTVGPEAVFSLQLEHQGAVCLTTFGTDESYDTAISLRNNCADTNSEIACNDDATDNGVFSQVELLLDADSEPFVIVDSLANGGTFLLTVSEEQCPNCYVDLDCPDGWLCREGRCLECIVNADCDGGLLCSDERCVFPPCLNDNDCVDGSICVGELCIPGERGSCDVDEIVALGGLGVTDGTTLGARATLSAGCAQTQASPEVVHELTFDQAQTVCISTEGSAFDTVVYARSDCSSDRSQVKCDDDGVSGPGLASQFTLNALANVSYSIVVDGKDGVGGVATEGAYRLAIQAGPCPQCDADGDCANGRFCANTLCVECRDDNDCDGAATCEDTRCVEAAQACDADTPCPADDNFFGAVGQDCDFALGAVDGGICVERGMCRDPIPIQIGDVVDGDNIGRDALYRGTCGGRGVGAEVIYTFEAPADGVACFTVVQADYDVAIYLKDICATNPAVFSSGFLECEDTAGNEQAANRNDRFGYGLTAGERYYFVVDSNAVEDVGQFTIFTHYGQCGAVPAPQCDVDSDCALGQVCTEQSQCVSRIGTCDDPTEVTAFGRYIVTTSTARNQLEPAGCDVCANPGGGRCGDAVYHYRSDANRVVCVSTEGSNYDTVLYAHVGQCGQAGAEVACSDDVPDGRPHSQLQLNVQAGVDYYFVADAWSNAGRLELSVTDGACP